MGISGVEFAQGRAAAWGVVLAWTISLMALPAAAQDGDLVWARAMGGMDDDQGNGIAVDGAGNVYTTGVFLGTADFDPGPGTFELTSAGSRDIFVKKLDADGNLLWARAMGGTSSDEGIGIAVDGAGNVYTIGFFLGTADFDPGPGTFELTSVGNRDIFVSKLDTDGNLLWAQAMGGPDGDEGIGIAVDDTGNIYTTGVFQGTVDFDPGEGSFNLTSAGETDIFVQKLDADGNFVWARAMGGAGVDEGNGIAVDGARNVYTTGRFHGTADFDPGQGAFNLTSAEFSAVFVHKLDADGNFVWARAMGGTGSDVGNGIAVDGAGNVHTVGRFSGTVDFDPGPGTFELTSAAGNSAIFVQKLNADGVFVWARAMGGPGVEEGNGIALDDAGNAYTTGFFQGTADFDPGTDSFNLTSAGQFDIFVQKLDADGNLVWARSMGGPGFDESNGIAVDGAENVYTTGHFSGTADFDPGLGSFNITSAGNEDIFVQKLSGSLLRGDINGDGFVDAVDVQLAINAALGIAINPAFDADINSDGAVNAVDVQLVINAALGVV